MPRASLRGDPAADESGTATLEFIMVGLLLLVPLVYLVVTLGLIQGQSLGVQAAARHVSRAMATSADATDARTQADAVLAAIARDYDIDPDTLHLDVGCTPAGAACPQAGALLRVTVRARVALPLAPSILHLHDLAAVPVQASAVQRVGRAWGAQ